MAQTEKYPWDKWFARDWISDPQLSRCGPLARGVWKDAIDNMLLSGRTGRLVGSYAELARLCRCSEDEMRRAAEELFAHCAADGTEKNGVVTLINRRMRREFIARKKSNDRKKRQRSKSVTRDVTPMSRLCHGVEAEAEAEADPPNPPAGGGAVDIPSSLNAPDFLAAWADWQTHRRQIRHKLTPLAAKMQLASCAKLGRARAIAAIQHSIGQGWTGLFESKNGHHAKQDEPTREYDWGAK